MKDELRRGQWANKAEFLLSLIGLAVGIGNIWRFPYRAYQNGGGAYMLAYIVMLLLVGKPLFFAELALGQFASLGTVKVWRCLPIAKGVGIAMAIVSVVIAIYFNVVMSYTLYYMAQSLRTDVPWKTCSSWWGADYNCYVRQSNQTLCREVTKNLVSKYLQLDTIPEVQEDIQAVNITWKENTIAISLKEYNNAFANCNNKTQTASEQFWEKYVLHISSGLGELGSIKWDLALSLFVCWVIVYFGLVRGVKSSGKVVYFTATFPYVILIMMVAYGCSLPGAMEGLKYLFVPDWNKLFHIQVWRTAAEQLLYSLSIGSGCLIMQASYNAFDNNIYRDAMFVSLLDFITSLLGGVTIFSVLGNLATEMNIDISIVVKGGQGLAFTTYPEALARLPVPQLWSVSFFFMLFLLAIDSQFSYLESFFTAIYDEFPLLQKRKSLINLFFCIILFILGLPCVTEGGQYVFNLMDTYGGGFAGICVAMCEIIALMWIYGADRFSEDLHFMLGFKPGIYWRICWKYISPFVLLFIVIYSMCTHKLIEYGGIPYPLWGDRIGWCLYLISVLQIPIWAGIQLFKHRKDWKKAFKPHADWGPADSEIRQRYKSHFTSMHEKEYVINTITDCNGKLETKSALQNTIV
ncbi:sodium- and chloride-dependent glycine transporter 2 [Parasteatoda tepidariorum]|uniref:sodium- and chloride-dependent glycine transporter 2 n=1 Tax=Parasteatoda tepidariorum TaxID=114398 RepID=UPI001C718346|nr:sodium- and chloride-dependent glycine transporter 2 [Parasteatoda tepidariorum]XP_042895105.1 sodium- and chloride-dependent glycine transporter 2 [Parasteatoda tepidariorum]